MPRTKLPPVGANKRTAEHNLYDHRALFGTTGNIWYVDSGAASGGNGLSPEGAVQTIDAAINLCTASNGDIIIVMEGHAESITGAAGIAADVAGITIIGLGRGRNRPVITFTTAAGASFDISAANIHVENLVLICGIDDQTAIINVTAADSVIRNCELLLSDASFDAEAGIIYGANADRFLLEGCKFHQTGNTAVSAPVSFGACDNSVIRGCNIQGYHGTAGSIINSAAAVNVTIEGNVIVNNTADGNNKAIVLHASTVGMVSGNRMAIVDSTGPAPVTAAAAYVSGNYFTGAVGVTASTLL